MGDTVITESPANAELADSKLEADWREIVAQKRTLLQNQIPAEWRLSDTLLESLPVSSPKGIRLINEDVPRRSGILSDVELEITENYSASQLLQKLASREYTSLAVTTAFCKRAAIAQQLTSCLTEHFFTRAFDRAKYLDDYLEREGKLLGPLHGLPISLKDSFCLEGIQTTVGYVAFLKDPPAKSNSALVNMLLDLGAVLYVKTNIPQTMMTADSENNIFGRTLNPHNTNLTAGGSTGGEGALVAFRGSILGVGSDVAGSIRIPALCCGIYGFKPTADRIPFGGQKNGVIEGLPGLRPSAGPLSHNLDDIELFLSTILDSQPWKYDVTAISAPWNKRLLPANTQSSRLTIGVLAEDKNFSLHPPIRRTLDSAIAALEKKGHRIVQLENTPALDIAYGNRLAFQYFIYGPRVNYIAAGGEPPITSVAHAYSPMFTGSLPVSNELDLYHKITGLHAARKAYSDAWRKAWVENSLDVILAPASQNTAVPHDTYGWPPYTLLWNLLDYPACVIPYGQSSKELDPEPMVLTDGVQPSYDPNATDGAPCAVQVIAPKFQDEKCLFASRIIDRDIQ